MAGNYSNGEAALLALIQTVTGYTSANTSRGKWGILNTGKSNTYAILKPGRFGRRRFVTPRTVETPWSTIIQVWQRYKDDGTSMTDLEANAALIMAKVDADPNLSDSTGTVLDSNLTTGEIVQEMWKRGGGPAWLMWELTVEWTEQSIVTLV